MIQLTEGAEDQSLAFASVDGQQLLYDQFEVGTGRDLGLQIAGPNGSNPRSLTPASSDANVGATEAAMSPDGKWIVFNSFVKGGDHGELHLMNADGSNERLPWVAPAKSSPQTPDWGP